MPRRNARGSARQGLDMSSSPPERMSSSKVEIGGGMPTTSWCPRQPTSWLSALWNHHLGPAYAPVFQNLLECIPSTRWDQNGGITPDVSGSATWGYQNDYITPSVSGCPECDKKQNGCITLSLGPQHREDSKCRQIGCLY